MSGRRSVSTRQICVMKLAGHLQEETWVCCILNPPVTAHHHTPESHLPRGALAGIHMHIAVHFAAHVAHP